MRRSTGIAAFALAMVMAGTSNAAIITRGIEGEVTSVNGASNIAVGDTISGQVSYDDNGITPGFFSFVPLDGSDPTLAAGSLELVFPDQPNDLVLDETDGNLFGAGFPTINFDTSGDFAGLDFSESNLSAFGFTGGVLEFQTGTFTPTFSFFDAGTEVVGGNLTLEQPKGTSVPVPASLGLLGTALIGLWAATRKRQV